jgi:hypothetical protein
MVKFGEVILPVQTELPQIFCFCCKGMQRDDSELREKKVGAQKVEIFRAPPP